MKTQSAQLRTLLAGAALLALAVTPVARADYQSTVLSQGPVGYWRLDETVQPQQIAGAANTGGSLGASALGTYNSFPTRGLAGPFTGSTAIGLDGGSQSVTTPWVTGLNTANFSFEIWVNPAQVPKFAYVGSSVHIATTRSGWYMAQDDGSTFHLGDGFVVRMFYQNGTTPSVTLFATNDLPLGSWYHLVLTYDGTTAILYKNGVAASSVTTNAFVPNVDEQLSVGCRSDNNFFWPGKAAEVAMYGSALSAAKVSAHYTAATTTPASYVSTVQADSPLAYYRYQEPIDPPAANVGSFGNAADGLYVYDAKAGVAGPSQPPFQGFEAANKAVAFDAGGGVVRLPALNLDTNTVTISCWVNATGAQAIATGLVICKGGTTESGLTIDQVDGGLGLGYVWNGNNYGWAPTRDFGFPTLPDSQWAYVALVVQPDQAALYLCDRTNVADFTSITNSFNVSHANQAFDGATLVGAEAGFTTRSFNGAIDEVAIFNRALSAGELYSQYASAVGGVPPKIFTDLQPPADLVYVGNDLVLQIDVGGTPPLTYTWHRGTTTVGTTTNGVLTIANASLGDSGTYSVTITNASGTASSQSVSVLVNPPSSPAITAAEGFQNRTLYEGGTLRLAVVATGGGLKYQWYKEAAPIASATASVFTIASVTTNDAGRYAVSLTNSLGSASNGPVTIAVPATVSGTYEALIIASKPEAWWRLDEPAGSTNLFDGMGRHDGYYTNINGTVPPVVLGVPGALANDTNTAASFSASGGIGVVPYSPALNALAFTYEGWVKTTVLNDVSLVPFSSTFGDGGLWWQTVPAGLWSPNSTGGYYDILGNGNTASHMNSGIWTHLVMCYDGNRVISGTHYPWTFFIDGLTDGFVWTGPTQNAGGPVIIGGHGVSATTLADSFFNGQVDEVAVYDRVLPSTEIQSHFQGRFGSSTPPYFIGVFVPQTVTVGKSVSFSTLVQGSAPLTLQWYKNGSPISGETNTSYSITSTAVTDTGTYTLWATNNAGTNSQSVSLTVIPTTGFANVTNGLVLHLRFDGNVTDSSGRGNNGTAVGTPAFVTGLIGSNALQYTTVTLTNSTSISVTAASYVNLGTPADLAFHANSSFTIGLWVRLPTNYPGGDLPFIGNAKNSNNNPGWDLSPSYGGGGWQWCMNDGVVAGITTNNINVNGGSLSDGQWHHTVLAVDRTGHTANTYLDGVLIDSRDISTLGSIDTGSPITIGQDPTGLYPQITTPSANDLDVWGITQTATLDDLGVWNRALTALEVVQIESAGITAGHSFDTVSPNVTITVTRSGSSLTFTWERGTLQQSDTLGTSASWSAVPGAGPTSYTFTPASTGNKFYRVQVQ